MRFAPPDLRGPVNQKSIVNNVFIPKNLIHPEAITEI